MMAVGITGGMGSGKSLVCRIVNMLGIPIYDADEHAKRIMVTDALLKKHITGLLGTLAYRENGQLNRTYISEIVFTNPDLLAKLNALVHPAVYRDAERWQNALPSQTPYFLRESALLFETGFYKNMDFNILVTAPEALRIRRIVARVGMSEKAIKQRFARQWTDEEKEPLADAILRNDGGFSLIQQVWQLHQQLIRLALTRIDKLPSIRPQPSDDQ